MTVSDNFLPDFVDFKLTHVKLGGICMATHGSNGSQFGRNWTKFKPSMGSLKGLTPLTWGLSTTHLPSPCPMMVLQWPISKVFSFKLKLINSNRRLHTLKYFNLVLSLFTAIIVTILRLYGHYVS